MSASVPKNARWTAPEIARLRVFYPVMSRTELVAAFPLHPLGSILSTANHFGLRKVYGNRKWREIAARHVSVFAFNAAEPPARAGAAMPAREPIRDCAPPATYQNGEVDTSLMIGVT